MLEKLALTYYTPRNDVGCGAVCVCVLYWNVVFHLSVCLRLSPSVLSVLSGQLLLMHWTDINETWYI